MNSLLRKIIYWGAVLSIYGLMVAGVLRLLLASDLEQPSSHSLHSTVTTEEGDSLQSMLGKMRSSDQFSGVLLPLGPDDGHLPGDHAIWRDFLRVRPNKKTNIHTNGFDGLQSVSDISELLKGSVSELFLSGVPQQVFRRDHFLYVMNDKGQVRTIDCEDPSKPRIVDSLDYLVVKHMEMQGTTAYLLLRNRRGSATGMMIVVDLKVAGEPREIARVEVPIDAASLFFVNSQLVVYTSQKGSVGNDRVYLYGVNDRSQIGLLGSADSPFLGDHSLQYDNYILAPKLGGGVLVYDFSNPLNAEQVASLESPVLNRLARYGSMVFATGLGGELYGIDFQDPAQPVLSTVVAGTKHPAYFLELDDYSYFFTLNGYLRVYDFSIVDFQVPDETISRVAGELVALPRGTGFTLLGTSPASMPTNVTKVLAWPGSQRIVDHLVWRGLLVVLDDVGSLKFYRVEEDASLSFWRALQLASPQRWMTASGDYLYVGGEKTISVVAVNGVENISVLKPVSLPGKESWDGLVLQDTLLLAAGKDGLLTYSLQRPDSPVAVSGWLAPGHLQSEVDVRHLTATSDERVLFTAGRAGLFSGRMNGDRDFRLTGSFRFRYSAHAIAIHDGLALVSTEKEVCVVDIRDDSSFQKLGKISFPAVVKFAVDPPYWWAGYTVATGWSFLPLPRLLRMEGKDPLIDETQASCADELKYRLYFFDDRDIEKVSGLVHLADCRANHPVSGGPLVH